MEDEEQESEERRKNLGAADNRGDGFGMDRVHDKQQGRDETDPGREAEVDDPQAENHPDRRMEEQIDQMKTERIGARSSHQGIETNVQRQRPQRERTIQRHGLGSELINASEDRADIPGAFEQRVVGNDLEIVEHETI